MIVENSHEDEEMDLVDNNDNIIGVTFRSDVYRKRISNYRVINAFLYNNSNQLFIPIRSSTKKMFPDSIDFSVGGHVKRGESYLEALYRECEEELNIKLDVANIFELLYLNPFKDDISSFMKIWLIEHNDEIEYNKSDFRNAYWLSFSEIEYRIAQGEKTKDDIKKVLKIIRERNLGSSAKCNGDPV